MQHIDGGHNAPYSRNLNACRVFVLILSLVTAVWAEPQSSDPPRVGIGNFGMTNKNYYRGSQPDAAGFLELKQLGVRTVINLRDDGKRDEPALVRRLGMQYFNIPLSSRRPATAAQTEYFLNLVTRPQNWPVYVHCAGGKHRTGEMTAIYRISHDGWTAEQAYKEMKRYGYYSLGGHGSLKDYVFQYYRDHQSAKAKVPSPQKVPPDN